MTPDAPGLYWHNCTRTQLSDGLSVRSPLRWAGSKRRSLPKLRSLVPTDTKVIIEPFAGSACLTLSITGLPAVIGDINERLTEFYLHLKQTPEQLHAEYSSLEASRDNYYRVRERFNNLPPSSSRAAHFLYLNRYCFNGIYRVNKAGQYNVPWGGEKTGKQLTLTEILNASTRMRNISIATGDFDDVVKRNFLPGCLVYLDPPYARDEQRVFREYHQNSFATRDWDRLIDLLHWIDRGGGRFLLSYAGDESLAEPLTQWTIGHIDVTRNVGGFRQSRRKHREFMAMNYVVADD